MTYYKKHSTWLDLNVDIVNSNFFNSKEEVNFLLKYYNIPKEYISERKTHLIMLCKKILSNNECQTKEQKYIIENLEKRINYFENLEFLYNNEIIYPDANPHIYNEDKLSKYFFQNIQHPIYKNRYLNNTCMYDVKNNSYWGELWLELIDPAHRELDFYKKNWINEKSTDSFFIYLEKQNISHREQYTNFILDDELKFNKVEIQNGLILLNKTPFTSPQIIDRFNEAVFIINNNTDIFLTLSSQTKRHLSLSRGFPVLGGGIFIIEDGIIKEIKGNSGHYLFYTEHMIQCIEILKSKGVELKNDIKISNFTDFYSKEDLSLSDFQKKYNTEGVFNAYQYSCDNYQK